jgi:hypothetical protein
MRRGLYPQKAHDQGCPALLFAGMFLRNERQAREALAGLHYLRL